MKLVKRKTLFFLFFVVIGVTQHAKTQTLVEYDIRNLTWDGTPVAASTVETNVTASNITVTGPAAYDTDFWGGSPENMWLDGWEDTFNSEQNYYEFTISADTGFELELSEITVGVANENGSGSTSDIRGPITFRLYSDIDGFSEANSIAEVTIPHESGASIRQNTLTSVLGTTYDGISSVTFRVYAFGNISPDGGGGIANFFDGFSHGGFTFTLDGTSSNVIISGTVFDPGELSITDAAVSNLGETEATFSSSVPSDGGDVVTDRGFVYAETAVNPSPEIGGTGVANATSGSGTGSFSEIVTGLDPVTEYAVRSYVSTSSETIYSDVTTFATLGPELVRYDIGALNPYDGNPLPASFVEANVTAQDLTFDDTDLSADSDVWGDASESIFLIGWQETLDVSKNYFEFTVEAAENYTLNLSNVTAGVGRESTGGIRGPKIFQLYSNIDGFSAGNYIAELQLPDEPGTESVEQRLLTTGLGTAYSGIESVTFRIYAYDDVSTGSGGEIPGGGLANFSGDFSIDEFNFTVGGTGSDVIISGVVVGPPTVTTSVESSVNATSADFGGEVTDDGGDTVTDKGIVWNTTGTPDIDNDNVVSMSSGTGSFSQSVGLLPFGTTIFFRAYATNGEGTAYGSEESFDTDDEVSASLTGAEGWRLLSVPGDVTLNTFLNPIWTQGVNSGGDTDFGTPNVYTWSSTLNNWEAVTDLNGTTLEGGHGMLVYVYSDDDYNESPADAGFSPPKTLPITGQEYASGVSPTMNSNATGWTLLGNPFASAVSFSDLSPSNLTDIVYVWDPNDDSGDENGDQPENQDSGSWKTWNGAVGDVAGGRIAPFQGFLVQNSSVGSSVTFTQAGKTDAVTTFLGKQQDNQISFVRLKMEGNDLQNSTWLEFTPGGSSEYTAGDAWELQPLSGQYALLATRKADGSLVDIGRYPQAGELEIPLITEATQPGNYTIQATDFEAPGQTLYLSDLQTGESIRLEKDTRYEFTINQTAKTPADPLTLLQSGLQKKDGSDHRFVISTSALDNQPDETPQTFTLEQNYPNPFNPSTVISYQLPENSRVRLEVFDMAGRQIATLISGQQEAGSHTVNFDGSNLSSGVYMYRLHANGNVFTKKLTLIK